jgi:hypothetical protein
MPLEALTTFVYALLVAVLLLMLLVVWLLYKVIVLTRGANGTSLEGSIQKILSRENEYANTFSHIHEALARIEEKMRRVVRNVKTNRFDPFEGAGSSGKQSFAVALLDEEGNGAVISSLHTQTNVRVFAKPIQNFTSTHELSDEEKRVIADAK